ncbi:MAG: hypothetical protein ACREBJ_00015 [Nitrosotalea sp.]
MSLLEVTELYNLISRGSENVGTRKQSRQLRKVALGTLSSGQGFTKMAFDTRRIDQETEYNPRRGLQNYQRSEAFITEGSATRVKNFAKLRNVLNGLKNVYGKEHEWQDSNARVLLTAIDKGLRTTINDGDFGLQNQPGVGSFDYLDELINVRYRLTHDQLTRIGETDLAKVILAKDEELTRKDVKQALEITKGDVANKGYDSLIEKLFDGCKASAENPDVERTITITIRDRFHKEG